MDISSLKILIAEDSQLNILLMKKLLSKWDIIPDFAENGLEAVEAFKANAYDLIFMDIQMPILNGYEAAKLIRSDENEKKSKVHIIALTASMALDARNEIAEAGINDFISKPFNIEELKLKLEQIASNKI